METKQPLLSQEVMSETKTKEILSGEFVTTGNKTVTATLSAHSLRLASADGSFTKVVDMEDVVGAEIQAAKQMLMVHSYPRGGGCCGGLTRAHVETPLHTADSKLIEQWHLRVNQVALKAPLNDAMPKKSVLILVNPASGSGRAMQRFHEIEPMLRQSPITLTVTQTTHAGHAQELAKRVEVGKYDVLATVSGDGLLSEVVNGMFDRPDWQQLVASTAIHTIPGGSGNGLAKSILEASGEAFNVTSAAFLLIKCGTRKVDMFTVTQQGSKPMVGFLTVGWALVSDIDFESENWRCCGGARFTFTAVLRLCCLRSYNAVMQYLPAPRNQVAWTDEKAAATASNASATQHQLQYKKCSRNGDCSGCVRSEDQCEVQQMAEYLADIRKSSSEEKKEVKSDSKSETKDDNKSAGSDNSSNSKSKSEKKYREPASDEWVSMSDDFVTVWGMNVQYPASDMRAAPYAHWSDGCMDLQFLPKVGCCPLTAMFLGMESGDHVTSKILHYVKVRGLRLTSKAARRCDLTIDGERMSDKPTEVRMFRGIANVICR